MNLCTFRFSLVFFQLLVHREEDDARPDVERGFRSKNALHLCQNAALSEKCLCTIVSPLPIRS